MPTARIILPRFKCRHIDGSARHLLFIRALLRRRRIRLPPLLHLSADITGRGTMDPASDTQTNDQKEEGDAGSRRTRQ